MKIPPAAVTVVLVFAARVAYANPVILTDADLDRARLGAMVILVAEAILATVLVARAGLRFWRALPAVVLLNFATYVPLSRFLVHYGTYEIALHDSFLWAEGCVLLLEAMGLWGIGRLAFMRTGERKLSAPRAAGISLLVNFLSVVVSVLWAMYVEEHYTP